MFASIFSIVAPIFFIVGVGYLYGSRVRPEMAITNQLNMDVFIPALIFHVLIKDGFSPTDYVLLMFGGLCVIFGSGVLAFGFAKILRFEWRTVVPPAMFSNWANLGLPLYVFSLGEVALDGGVVLVVIGNVLSFTLGIYIFSGSFKLSTFIKTPILLAVILGLSINLMNLHVPNFIEMPIGMLGQVAIPLMLFSLGVRLTKISWSDSRIGIAVGLFCPIVGIIIAWSVVQALPLSDLHSNILILFGALPPAVINFMLAEQYGGEPEKVASIVLIGNLLAIISIPLVLLFVL